MLKSFISYNVKKTLIFLNLLIFFIFFYKIKLKKIGKIKVCLCTLGKKENKYIIEFLEYYYKYGIKKIFLYDNNDINGETFDFILRDYIKKKFVKIINFRGIKKPQLKMLNNCYKNNYKKYDWFLFFDIDEFIVLKNYKNIKNFLINTKFNKCKIIYLNRAFHTDNNQIYYKNLSLFIRFPTAVNNVKTVKPIIRGNISKLKITNQHTATSKYLACNGFGQTYNKKKPDFKYNYIKHFFCKSTEEFIEKINRGTIFRLTNDKNKLQKIKYYFLINKITSKKINYIENGTGLNLNIIRKRLK